MNDNTTKVNGIIDELESKIYYAETPHAALYESNSIYLSLLRKELDELRSQQIHNTCGDDCSL
jgi:hypothetical protein